jgi:hypothetical protein
LRDSDSDFSDVNATYGEDFVAFSQPGTLAPRGSNEIDVTFRRAGSGEPAVVNGFGAVFVDPDLPRTSSLRYYDADGALLATVFAPPRADPDEYTFAGAVFEGASVARVRITLGTAPVGPNTNDVSSGGTADVVVLDDVIYGEPQGLR